jgi:hypothetical protein
MFAVKKPRIKHVFQIQIQIQKYYTKHSYKVETHRSPCLYIKLLTSLALHIVQTVILLGSGLASSNTNYWAT